MMKRSASAAAAPLKKAVDVLLKEMNESGVERLPRMWVEQILAAIFGVPYARLWDEVNLDRAAKGVAFIARLRHDIQTGNYAPDPVSRARMSAGGGSLVAALLNELAKDGMDTSDLWRELHLLTHRGDAA